ncbi:DUR3 [[Candida] subhashii]|uniref:DUR3 n=1 Tax=[Candida] subhashii TaxID=561895 RepID=A0A8J5UE12_9ASCO|nr:DUR3 [[Candida] subhashii]KAG7660753.1 DUR3 [[Candida] subhashii]
MSEVASYPLPQSAGYAVVVGLGFVFAAGMMLTTYILKRYNGERMTSEEFSTAGRSVKTGLISSAVVSSWTWAATLLTSTTQVYNNGVSGGFFYAAGATCQITLFACLAIKGRERAPAAHTYLEIIRGRYGSKTHIIYIIWGFATNILVTSMLLTGGSAVVRDLTGMNPIASCLLLPLGVVVYTLFGGIKATILTDYAHTVVMVCIIIAFAFTTWATSDRLGSPGAVWEIVTKLAETQPREGNAGGSYFTMHSKSGIMFFVINIVGNFGTVFLDNGYFNKAFAANPASTYRGYILGSLAWLPIPAFCSLTMGLAALALEQTEYWPLGRRMTAAEVSAGLVLPNAASALLGQTGAVLSLLMVFMAVTSAMSAELIAVSTICTYDIYRTYVNPQATGKKLIWISHLSVVIFAYTMAAFSIGLYYAQVSLGYLYELMGIIIGGAVLSSALTLLYKHQNWHAATFTPPISTTFAIIAWLVCTKVKFGSISYDNTFQDEAMLTGNCVALLSPFILIPTFIFIFKKQNFDWEILKQKISKVDDDLEEDQPSSDNEITDKVKSDVFVASKEVDMAAYEEEQKILHNAFFKCCIICITLTVCLLVLWPMPMYGTRYIFSKEFFTGWVAVFFIWIFYTVFQVILFPLWESRESLASTSKQIFWELTGQKEKLQAYQAARFGKLKKEEADVLEGMEVDEEVASTGKNSSSKV